MTTYIPPKLGDEQIAKVIYRASQLVSEDARLLLVSHMYEMAYKYNENGNSALFAAEVSKFLVSAGLDS